MLLSLLAITQNFWHLSITAFAAKNTQRPVLTSLIWRDFTCVPTQISRVSCVRSTGPGHVVPHAHCRKY